MYYKQSDQTYITLKTGQHKNISKILKICELFIKSTASRLGKFDVSQGARDELVSGCSTSSVKLLHFGESILPTLKL